MRDGSEIESLIDSPRNVVLRSTRGGVACRRRQAEMVAPIPRGRSVSARELRRGVLVGHLPAAPIGGRIRADSRLGGLLLRSRRYRG